jgi:putative transposase
MIRSYKYRIYPNAEQAQKLEQFFGAARFVYNWGLEQKTKQYQQDNTHLSYFDLTNKLTKFINMVKYKSDWYGKKYKTFRINADTWRRGQPSKDK